MSKITLLDKEVLLQLSDRLSKSVVNFQYRLNEAINSGNTEEIEELRIELEQVQDNAKLTTKFIDEGLSEKRLKTVDEVLSSFALGIHTLPMD